MRGVGPFRAGPYPLYSVILYFYLLATERSSRQEDHAARCVKFLEPRCLECDSRRFAKLVSQISDEIRQFLFQFLQLDPDYKITDNY